MRHKGHLPRLRLIRGMVGASWLHIASQFAFGLIYWSLSLVWFRLEIKDAEHLRYKTFHNCIFVPNHKSYVDHFLIVSAFIKAKSLSLLPIRVLIRGTIYYHPILRPFLFALGTCPTAITKREQGESLRKIDALLKQGKRVGIYPEGRVIEEDRLGDFHRGIGVLVQKNPGIPVLPTAVRGTQHFKYYVFPPFRSKVTIAFGSPFVPDHTESSETITEKIRTAIHLLYEKLRLEI